MDGKRIPRRMGRQQDAAQGKGWAGSGSDHACYFPVWLRCQVRQWEGGSLLGETQGSCRPRHRQASKGSVKFVETGVDQRDTLGHSRTGASRTHEPLQWPGACTSLTAGFRMHGRFAHALHWASEGRRNATAGHGVWAWQLPNLRL